MSKEDDDWFAALEAGRVLEQRSAQRDLELADHRAACRLPQCDRCNRFACPECAFTIVDARARLCAACEVARDLPRFAERIPARFRDVLPDEGRLDALNKRPVKLPSEVVSSVLEMAREWVDPPWLLLVGPLRAGKTSLAVALLGAWFCGQYVAQRRRVRAARFVSAMRLGQEKEDHKLGSQPEFVREAIEAPVIILDDLGQEPARQSDVVRFVLRERADHERSTFITTWMTREELAARYSDAGFAARVYEAKRVKF